MKIRNRFVKGLLSAMMLTTLLAQTALASDVEPSDTNPYTFTVTLSAGNQGTFGGTDMVEESGLTFEKPQVADFSNYQNQLQIKDDKYYAKGIRLSGRDNSDTSYSPTWTTGTITEDADYVVAYGMKGDMVAYTVQYLDENGNELAPSNTFYGSIGDKPVVAFQYIEGYLPQAYNLTKTLSANEADNVFPFVYTPSYETIERVEVTEGGTTVITTTPAAGATAGGAAGGGAAAGGAAAGDAAGAAGEAGAADETAEIEDEAVPQDTIDLDDEDVPLAESADDDAVRETSAVPIVAGVIAAVVALAAIAGAVIYYRKRMK